MSKQVNVRFEGEVLKQLDDLAKRTHKSISDVLREAVNTTHWLYEQQEKKKILLQGEDDEHPVQVILR
jgi:predicted transcriptional regulator